MMTWPPEWKNIAEVNLYVLESNVKAIAIFVNWGFKVTKRVLGYLEGHNALKMVKLMDDAIQQPTQIAC